MCAEVRALKAEVEADRTVVRKVVLDMEIVEGCLEKEKGDLRCRRVV